MARKIDLSKPLNSDDAAYVRDRPWLIRDAELEGIKVRFADQDDEDFEVEDDEAEEADAEETEDYTGPEWTVKTLTAEIDARNEERDEDEQIVPDTARKDDLIAALLDDDEAMAESEEDEEDDSPEE